MPKRRPDGDPDDDDDFVVNGRRPGTEMVRVLTDVLSMLKLRPLYRLDGPRLRVSFRRPLWRYSTGQPCTA